MFLQFISIIILVVLAVVVLELRKIKKSVSDLQGQVEDINISNEPKRCVWEYTTENWWELELPKVIVPTKVLKTTGGKPVGTDVKKRKEIIEKVLKSFNVGVEKMNEPFVGPTITTYSFKPAMGIKLQEIVDLKNNISMELEAHPVRIEAPIPGTNLVGIEVPNQVKAFVGLKDELETKEFKETKGDLVIPFGRDMKFKQWNVDLHDLPHLLIGGATNSGKSNFFHSLIVSLVTKHSPNTLRFIMADPKRVDLPVYNNLPHLLTPVIMEHQKMVNALKWCVNEMDHRFESLSDDESRNIEDYNKSRDNKMPYIIFLVDEMADFSLFDEKKVIEENMIKLLQMGRAVGIHVIIGSARPCDETYSGLLRANFPARLAFSTASSVDSEIILDMAGAELLLGRGDALFATAEMVKPVRLQIPHITDEDIQSAINYIREESKKYKPIDAVASAFPEDNFDELYDEAKKIVIESGKASASFLQRKLQIGYARSASLMDQLENMGIVGPARGAEPRQVLVEPEESK